MRKIAFAIALLLGTFLTSRVVSLQLAIAGLGALVIRQSGALFMGLHLGWRDVQRWTRRAQPTSLNLAWAGLATLGATLGFLAAERREIEGQLFSGQLGGVVATSALELGIDVGGLDACVLNGFPGTIASLRQQMGRAGREGQPSLAVLVAGEDQLDRYFLDHPDEVFSRAPEPAVVNPSNPFVLDPHLACAAYERPLGHPDERWWGDHLHDGVRRLVLQPNNDERALRGALGGLGWRIVAEQLVAEGQIRGARALELVMAGAAD